jgi:DNA-binding HxlR family transcriptional regulator
MKYEPKLEKQIMCPLDNFMNTCGGKWKSRIICLLASENIKRYGEIRNELQFITDAVLAAMLKELIYDKIIYRVQYNEIPPKVEYYLTEAGKSTVPILQNMCRWSVTHTGEEPDNILSICSNCSHV